MFLFPKSALPWEREIFNYSLELWWKVIGGYIPQRNITSKRTILDDQIEEKHYKNWLRDHPCPFEVLESSRSGYLIVKGRKEDIERYI